MPADLCTVADVKALAGKDAVSVDDVVWAQLVAAASDFIRGETGRTYAVTAMNKLLDGNGRSELFLPGGPWTEVDSLTMCGVPVIARPSDTAPGYFLDDSGNLLCLSGYCFPKGKKCVRVIGSAGSNTIPPKIAQACKEIVIWAKFRGPIASQTQVTDGPSNQQIASFSMLAIPPTAALIIENERNKVPVT